MLVENKTILIIKLNSGEELIGKVEEETASLYKVRKPLTLVSTGTGVQFVPFLMMADADGLVDIPKPVITANPSVSIEQQYMSLISGIVLPGKKSIIT